LHLGRQLRLTVELAIAEGVRIDGDRIILSMHRPGRRDERAALLRRWRLVEAKRLYHARMTRLFRPFASYGLQMPRLLVRDLSHRWGSLTPNGSLVLSRNLIQAPLPCIDYVILHEFCHMVHSDHGDEFHRLIGDLMPDYSNRKLRLERVLL
jgi:hypothetical protein